MSDEIDFGVFEMCDEGQAYLVHVFNIAVLFSKQFEKYVDKIIESDMVEFTHLRHFLQDKMTISAGRMQNRPSVASLIVEKYSNLVNIYDPSLWHSSKIYFRSVLFSADPYYFLSHNKEMGYHVESVFNYLVETGRLDITEKIVRKIGVTHSSDGKLSLRLCDFKNFQFEKLFRKNPRIKEIYSNIENEIRTIHESTGLIPNLNNIITSFLIHDEEYNQF
jgi:hypothetical protein